MFLKKFIQEICISEIDGRFCLLQKNKFDLKIFILKHENNFIIYELRIYVALYDNNLPASIDY